MGVHSRATHHCSVIKPPSWPYSRGANLNKGGGASMRGFNQNNLWFITTSLCGVLVFDSVSRRLTRLARPPRRHTTLSHTTLSTPSLKHNFITHHLWHTTLSHTISHTPSFTHTHAPSFTTLSHTISGTPLCHTPSFTHHFVNTIFVTHTHTIFHTQLCHTTSFTQHLCHTQSFTHLCHKPSFTTPSYTHIFHPHLCHTPSLSHTIFQHTIFHTPSLSHTIFHTQLCVVGVALGDIHLRFAWQAWHLGHSGLALVARLGRD